MNSLLSAGSYLQNAAALGKAALYYVAALLRIYAGLR